MGLFDSDFSFPGAPYFDGAMTSEGSGARIRLDVKDIPVIGDVNVVNVSVPGFKRGGVIGEDPAARSRAKLAALHRANGTSGERATEANMTRRRQGGASAPTRRSSSGSSAEGHQHTSTAGAGRPHAIGAGVVLAPGRGMGIGADSGGRCGSCRAGRTVPISGPW